MLLITGGAGFIGSHTCVELIEAGYKIVVIDNFSNSSPFTLEKIREITGDNFDCVEADVRDKRALSNVFEKYDIDAVVHFAGYKAVGVSVVEPLKYYQNNLISSMTLLEVMSHFSVKKLLFSSSATVYHKNNPMPLTEDAKLGCINPYGHTKCMIEQMLKDICVSDEEWSVVSLRYFNPVGAHQSGLIGELPKGTPENLMPLMTQVASGKRDKLFVYGGDYLTRDGTGIRDYIHITDLAQSHVKALEYILKSTGIQAFNIGTGKGSTVLELLQAFETTTGITIPYEIVNRRSGDVAECYTSPQKAKQLLGWEAELGIEQMCADAWRFEQGLQHQDYHSK